MKKKLLFVFLTLIMASALVLCISAETPKVIQPGDVNGDGSINAKDAVMLAQYLAGWDVVLGGDSHTVVIDAAVPATCTQTGLTEGKHCSDCGMILVKQQTVPTIPHDFVETLVQPTTATQGYTLCKCKVCGYEQKKDFIPPVNSNGLAVEVNTANKTCVITGIGTCTDTDINIPAKISDYTVVGIADKAFSEQTQITSIQLPNTVKTLGQRAFYGCTGLTEFTVPASVTSIGHQVFYKCDNLATVYYNSSFSPDQDKVFLNIPSIKTVVFGGTSVPYQICYNCTNIEKVEILDSVKYIGGQYSYSDSYSFYGCTSLKEVTIGDSVTNIGQSAFYNCSSLTSLYISDLESWLNVELVYDSHPLYSAGGNLYIDGVLATDIEIPDTVKGISYCAFYNCDSLTSVEIPDSVTSIGSYAFYNCSSLTSVVIPDSVMGIGYYAFEDCSSLTNLYISDLESWLNVSLFGWESHPLYSAGGNLYIDGVLATDIKIPDTVTSIGYHFYKCRSLTSIEIPDSVTSIGSSAFYNCSSLTSIELPDSVTSIGSSAFYNCSSLTSVTIPDSVTSIGYATFSGCSSLTSIELPDSVTSIGNYAFDGCSSLTSVEIPDSVTSIGNYAFDGCSSLTSVEIPDSVTSIGNYAFYNCSSLTSVEIPASVTSIGYEAFYGCSSLVSIEIPDSVTSIGDWAFRDCRSLTNLYISDLESWLNVSLRDYYSHPLYYAGGNLYIDGVLATDIEIPDTVTSIGYHFYNCRSLTSVEIPDSVTSIGDYAFYGCNSLTNLYISDLESWLNVSLYNSYSHPLYSAGENLYIDGVLATDIKIPDTVTSIGNYAFYNCSSLTSVEIPDSVTSIDYAAFDGCSSLTSVVIPDSVTSIGGYAFYDCSSRTSVYYGGDATKWAKISIGSFNSSLTSATRYYYSATQPATSGNYWHYVDGKPTPW